MEDEEWLRFGVATALAKGYAADQRQFLELLARTLEGALPGNTEVVRGGFLRRGIREVRLQLGDHRYALADSGHGALRAERTLVKRGIALRTDELPVDAWIQEFGDAVQQYARRHQDAAAALRRFLG